MTAAATPSPHEEVCPVIDEMELPDADLPLDPFAEGDEDEDEQEAITNESVTAALVALARANGGTLDAQDSEEVFARIAKAGVTIDIGAVMGEVAAAGVVIAEEEIDEAAIERDIAAVAAAAAREGQAAGALDALTQMKHSLSLPLLTPEQERAMTHRIVGYRRAAAAVAAEEERIARDEELAFARVADLEAAPQTPDSAAAVEAALARAMSLREELERVRTERAAADTRYQELRDSFIRHNLRLAFSIARKVYGNSHRRVDFADLVQEANYGLVRAADKYEPSRGTKFSTLAHWFIRSDATEFSLRQTAGGMRISGKKQRQVRQQRRLIGEYIDRHGRNPSDEWVAEQLGIEPKKVYENRQADLLLSTGSLDRPKGDDPDAPTIGDALADTYEESAIAGILDEELKRTINDACNRLLNRRERRVIQARFGLWGDRQETLEEAGHRLLVTRERARQIEAAALAKLRRDPEIARLWDLAPADEPVEAPEVAWIPRSASR